MQYCKKISIIFVCFFCFFKIVFCNDEFVFDYDNSLPSLEKKVKNWNILSQYSKNLNKVTCYMYTAPFQKTGNHRDSRDAYLMITYISKDIQEVSISTGYKIKSGSKPTVRIKNSNFPMFTDGSLIWNKDKSDDFMMIENMIDDRFLFVHADSSIGTYSVDTYDVSSFYMAYIAMVDICKNL